MERKNSGAEAVNSGGYNFGTFGGVYTPALLTILGLVMYMRTNFVLGSAGFVNTLIILGVGASISLATTLSIAAIASCPSAPISWARTCPPHIASSSRRGCRNTTVRPGCGSWSCEAPGHYIVRHPN